MARKKGRSGVKPSTDMARARELFRTVVPDARWREMIDRMAEIALGDGPVALEAAELLLACAFGIPAQEFDGEDD